MGCAYTRPLKVFSNKAKEDVIPREAERSREAVLAASFLDLS